MTRSTRLQRLRVAVFQGAWNLPLWVGQEGALFESLGLNVELFPVPNSTALIRALYSGEVDIALAGADNFIAYQESNGEVEIDRSDDLRIVMGGDGGFLALIGRPGILSMDDLRGRTVAVDALTTGFAFVLNEMLRQHGIEREEVKITSAGGTMDRYRSLIAGDCDATLLRTPFEILALRQGCHDLCDTEFLGAYQGTVAAVRSRWADVNEAALVAFLRSYRKALQWCYRPDNMARVKASLISNLSDMDHLASEDVAARLLHPRDGLTQDMRVDLAGLGTVLSLRERFAPSGQASKAPNHYVDDRYLLRALAEQYE